MQTRGSCHWLVGTWGNRGSRDGPNGSKKCSNHSIHQVYISRVVSLQLSGTLNSIQYFIPTSDA
jgi:hypothetical protein